VTSVTPVSAAARLEGYLNGTHSGAHAVRGARYVTAGHVMATFRSGRVASIDGRRQLVLGGRRWMPADEAERELKLALEHCLSVQSVVDLVLLGSIARGSTTGYSDVDAILIVSDDVPKSRRSLTLLRSRVLEAGRAVLAYQPLQHHGFLVATPSLLRDASSALRLPAEAVEQTVSLFGRSTPAAFGEHWRDSASTFGALARSLLTTSEWPRHPWYLHQTVARFELVPALYLQARGRSCAKHESFDLACEDFPDEWHPYVQLERVRQEWPREARHAVQLAASVVRNPWTAVAVWRRVPASVPHPAARVLDDRCLADLHVLVRAMLDRVEMAGSSR
jgi:nucleotidyltransferase-like protein